MRESVALSSREIQGIPVLGRVCWGTPTLVEGTRLLRVCCRQAKRLLPRCREEGAFARLISTAVSQLIMPMVPRYATVPWGLTKAVTPSSTTPISSKWWPNGRISGSAGSSRTLPSNPPQHSTPRPRAGPNGVSGHTILAFPGIENLPLA